LGRRTPLLISLGLRAGIGIEESPWQKCLGGGASSRTGVLKSCGSDDAGAHASHVCRVDHPQGPFLADAVFRQRQEASERQAANHNRYSRTELLDGRQQLASDAVGTTRGSLARTRVASQPRTQRGRGCVGSTAHAHNFARHALIVSPIPSKIWLAETIQGFEIMQ
jgi:hypothetical protein